MISPPRSWAQTATALAALLFLSGCMTVGPDYEAPEIQTPDLWSEQVSEQVSAGEHADLQSWWKVFDDPKLESLIEQARNENLHLKQAISRIYQSRAMLAIARGEKYPVVDLDANISQSKLSDDGPLREVVPPNGFKSQNLFQLGIDAMWELDIFGRVTRQIESADAAYDATVEDYRDVLVTLLADVAFTYVDIRSAQQQIVYAKQNAKEQKDSLALTEERYSTGLCSKLDVVQATANLEGTLASIPQYELMLIQALNRLAVLMGQDAGTLQKEFSEPGPIPKATTAIGIGVPANVLRQRPDVRRAERQLAAQTAQIGVATADLYPSFGLSGAFSLQSNSLSTLLDSSSVTWGLGAPMQWNIFSGGQVRGNIQVQTERTHEMLLKYQQTVLNAIEEVENAISGYDLSQTTTQHLKASVTSTAEAVDLVLVQYNSGLTDFNNVLVTQRDLFTQQSRWASSEAQTTMNLIALYKALGGGWDLNENPAK
ncbi:efflux transporter outer membrane subunit [Kiritimatiellota bacterium B12222]|nr:efflux transporter outer membrane subunit [Kiritimatiellota bacterium B12222]